ncbi:MAG: 4-hydroxyphenylacetate 3-hydroxylase C-terminal domain-containing protein [Pseudomonadota bacterium]
MPAAADLEDPETGSIIKKYLAAQPDYAVLDRVKVLRLIENLTAGAGAVGYLIESMHGAGPPAAQRIMIERQAGIDGKVAAVRKLLSIA